MRRQRQPHTHLEIMKVLSGRGAGSRTRVTGPPALHNNRYTTPRLFNYTIFNSQFSMFNQYSMFKYHLIGHWDLVIGIFYYIIVIALPWF